MAECDQQDKSWIDDDEEVGVRKILKSLEKDEIINYFVSIATKTPNVYPNLWSIASKNPVHRAIIVKNILAISEKDLENYFSKFGIIENLDVLSSGDIAKITFQTIEVAWDVITNFDHHINDHYFSCSLCEPTEQKISDESVSKKSMEFDPEDWSFRKIFAFGLGPHATDQTLLELFQEYGEIEGATVTMDESMRYSRGFGFVTFKTVEGAKLALKKPLKFFESKKISCCLAVLGKKSVDGIPTQILSKTTKNVIKLCSMLFEYGANLKCLKTFDTLFCQTNNSKLASFLLEQFENFQNQQQERKLNSNRSGSPYRSGHNSYKKSTTFKSKTNGKSRPEHRSKSRSTSRLDQSYHKIQHRLKSKSRSRSKLRFKLKSRSRSRSRSITPNSPHRNHVKHRTDKEYLSRNYTKDRSSVSPHRSFDYRHRKHRNVHDVSDRHRSRSPSWTRNPSISREKNYVSRHYYKHK